MSQHYGDYEDFLRGALHAAVDSAEPAGDGLERIRTRLTTPHPLPVAWLLAVCSWVARRARGSLDSVSAWLQTVPGEVHRRDGAAEGRYTQRLRLVTTVAAVTVLLAISVSTLTPLGRHVLSQAGSVLNSIGGGEAAGTGEPGRAAKAAAAGAGAAGTTNGGQSHVQPAASCTPGASALAVPPAKPRHRGEHARASTSPASPPAASTGPASPPAATTGPASPPAATTAPASPSPPSPPQASHGPPAPSPSPSPSPPGSTSASASAASPRLDVLRQPGRQPQPQVLQPQPAPGEHGPGQPAPGQHGPVRPAPGRAPPRPARARRPARTRPAPAGSARPAPAMTAPARAAPGRPVRPRPARPRPPIPGWRPTSAGPEDSASG